MKKLLLVFLVFLGYYAKAQDKPFMQPYVEQDTLYSMTPTDDGREGYHLWVWKPSFESNMPVRKLEPSAKDPMILDPLREAPMPKLIPNEDMFIPENKMPNPMEEPRKPFE